MTDVERQLAEALAEADRPTLDVERFPAFEDKGIDDADWVGYQGSARRLLSSDWLEDHDRKIAAGAVRAFATDLREKYTGEVFTPVTPDESQHANSVLAHAGIVRDRLSADMLRRAAVQADHFAEEIERGD